MTAKHLTDHSKHLTYKITNSIKRRQMSECHGLFSFFA